MTNNTFTVVGKVNNGKVMTIVASENRMVGHIRPLVSKQVYTPNEIWELKKEVIEVQEEIDSPFIQMCNEQRKRAVEQQQSQPQPKKRKRDWFDRIHCIR